MNKNILLILITAILLVFSGCSLTSSSDSSQSGFSLGGGSSTSKGSSTSGVTLEFAQNNPSSEIYKDRPVNFAFIFKNYQDHEITDLAIKSKAYDTGFVSGLSIFEGSSGKTGIKIPKSSDTQGPGIYPGLIASGVVVTGFESEKYNFNPAFDYCYSAKTSFIEQVCVPSATTNNCDIKFDKFSNQNGPLTVTIDTLRDYGNNIVGADITVKNSGNGQVVNSCFKTDDYAVNYNNVIVKLGSTIGDCKASSGYQMLGGESKFYCEFKRTSDESYTSQLTVEFDYLYQNEFKQNIVVINPQR